MHGCVFSLNKCFIVVQTEDHKQKLKGLDEGPVGENAIVIVLWNSNFKPRQSSSDVFYVA